jgi:hypothetical protein
MPEEYVSSNEELSRKKNSEDRRIQRNLRAAIWKIVLGVIALVLIITGFAVLPKFLSSADQNKPKTNVVQPSQPTMETQTAQKASAEENKVKQEAVQNTPDGYLALLSMDPAAVPPDKKPVAQILNNASAEAAQAGAPQLQFLRSMDATIFRPLQAAKTKDDLEKVRTQATQLKEIAQTTEKSFTDLQEKLSKRLESAGVAPDLAAQTTSKFIDQARTYKTGESDPALEASQSTLAMIDLLEQHPGGWSRRDDGALLIENKKVLEQYKQLSTQLSQEVNRLASRVSGH